MKGDITMGQIKVEKNVGGIDGLCVIMPTVHGDGRGYFMETYNQKDMEEAGFHINCRRKGSCGGFISRNIFPSASSSVLFAAVFSMWLSICAVIPRRMANGTVSN